MLGEVSRWLPSVSFDFDRGVGFGKKLRYGRQSNVIEVFDKLPVSILIRLQ